MRSPAMVDPAARRGGIATAPFNAAVPLCRERGASSVLLVVPGGSTAGQAFARHRGGTLEHSEHAMRLDAKPSVGRSDPRLRLRAATRGDAAAVARLLERGFGHRPADPKDMTDPAVARTLLAELDGIPVATVRLERDGAIGGVYGFAVDPARRGNGVGRDMLGRVCALLLRREPNQWRWKSPWTTRGPSVSTRRGVSAPRPSRTTTPWPSPAELSRRRSSPSASPATVIGKEGAWRDG